VGSERVPRPDLPGMQVALGCAGLMRVSRRERTRFLERAYDTGVRHFDVARMYGLGAAEAELGRVLGAKRDSITIATKFGIEPGRLAQSLSRCQGPARAVLARAQHLRAAVKGQGEALSTRRTYDVAVAARSLEESLRRLGTDRVDVLLLHDPRPGDSVQVHELREFFEAMQKAGKIVAWGVSADGGQCLTLTESLGGSIPQVRRNLASIGSALVEPGRRANVFGVIQPALDRLLAFARSHPEEVRRQHGLMSADLRDPDAVARLLVAEAGRATMGGTVLVGTTNARHLATALGARSVEPETVDAFREFALRSFRAHLAP
jgi:D-threo-aldose 1-dehydrogenase